MENKDLPFPEKETSSIVLFSGDITKEEIKTKAETTIAQVTDGAVNPMETYIHIRAVKELADNILKGIKPTVEDELSKLHADERNFRGVGVSLTGGRTKYDFSLDETWKELKEEEAELKERIKNHEQLMIQVLKHGDEVYNSEGVAIESAIIVGGTEPSIKVQFPK